MHRHRVDQAGADDDIGICGNQLGGGGLAPLGILPGHAALDDEIAPLDPAEPPQGVKEIAARERLPGDDETDMCALGRLLRRCAADDGGSRHAE